MKKIFQHLRHWNRETSLVGFIILVALVLAIASSWHDVIVVDEDPHIGAGYSYVSKQDMRLNPEHPPFAKDLAGIPLLFLNLKQGAFDSTAWTTDHNGQWEFGRKLIFNSGNDADRITHTVKIAMMLLFVISALFLYRWTRNRYGTQAGMIALILFSFSPTIMAHARFVTTDMAALTGVLISTYYFVRFLKDSSRRNFWLSTITFGIAMLMKFSTVLLVPFFLLLALLWNWRRLKQTILVMLLGFLVIVWPVYFFHVFNYPPARQRADTEKILSYQNKGFPQKTVLWMSDKPFIRAAGQYGLGLLMVMQRSAGGNTVYFRGNVTLSGGPSYFPFVYLIKEPLPWLILLAVAIIVTILKLKARNPKLQVLRSKLHDKFDEIAMLLWLVIYWGVSIHSTLNIGVRHLLPIYPFTIILVSGCISRLIKTAKIKMENDNAKSKILNFKLQFYILIFTVCILTGWYVFENISVYPYYLTYFNQTVGGPSGGYRYVVDSNLDWGQDLRRLADWTKDHNINKIDLDYFGWADQYHYLGNRFTWTTVDTYKSEEDFLSRNTSNGWIAVSATYIMNNFNTKYAWLYANKPYAVIGNSIFVYHLMD